MSAIMQIELDADAVQEIRELAAVLHLSPEEMAEQVVANGMHMMRRYAFYEKGSETASAAEGLEILRSAGRNNPPDPGDEIPEDLKHLYPAPR